MTVWSTDKYPSVFRIGSNTYGVQGHPECPPDIAKSWISMILDETDPDRSKVICQFIEQNHEKIVDTNSKFCKLWITRTFDVR